MMDAYSLSDARANLAELLTRAESGEVITITRHGVPAAVLLGHRRWMKTETHDVLIQGRRVGRLLEEARSKPFPELPNVPNYDGKAHADEIRRDRGRDPWDVHP